MKIGFFDSGLGGLTILKATAKALPDYDYVYYGDTKHLPYGDKSEREIYELTKTGVEYLFARECTLVIIACNTASAETLRQLQDKYLPNSDYRDRRILGVIIPVIEEVIEAGLQRSLMFATRRTVSSGKYHLELGKRNVIDQKIESVATPELVPLIESGKLDEAFSFIDRFIEPRVGEVDGILLGCTHYTLLKEKIREKYHNKLIILSQDEIIPKKLAVYLKEHQELEGRLTRGGERSIHLTEHRTEYDQVIATLLDGHIIDGE